LHLDVNPFVCYIGTMTQNLFTQAIQIAGSETRLAKAIGYSQHAVWHARQKGRPSAAMAVAIHRFTEGAVAKWSLRPDLFDTPAAGG
jgi:DNA-binding transcriptional regulator YdaS (Cro superfamily)